MKSLLLTALTAVSVVSAENKYAQTWYSTSFLTVSATSWREIAYGSAAVTPVPTSTALGLFTSYLHGPLASRNINVTTWPTVTKMLPLTTVTPSIYTTRSLPTVTLDGTSTKTTYLTTTVATVTLSSLVLPNGSPPASTATVYTGTYRPVPGQEIASGSTQTAWPTAVTVHQTITDSYRVFTYTGSTSTITSLFTEIVYRTTATASTTTTIELLPCVGYHHSDMRMCTHTVYTRTATHTKADAQLDYVNATRTVYLPSSGGAVPTVTYAAKCAPTNLISARSAHGVAVELSPDDFTFPGGFPGTLIGIPPRLVPDAAACCQLCVENEGCAASEWTLSWETACRLFYRVPAITANNDGERDGGRRATDSCGSGGRGRGGGEQDEVPVKYYANVYALPGQGSFIQTGCGSLKYLGLKDPFCPSCAVDE